MWLLSQFQEAVRWEVVPAIHADLGGQAMDVLACGASIRCVQRGGRAVPVPDVFGAAVGMSGTYQIEQFYDGSGARICTSPRRCGSCRRWRAAAGPAAHAAGGARGRGQLGGTSGSLADGGRAGGRAGAANRVDNWGPQWAHDWPTWHQMLPQYLRELT
jgi:hypothetical protein